MNRTHLINLEYETPEPSAPAYHPWLSKGLYLTVIAVTAYIWLRYARAKYWLFVLSVTLLAAMTGRYFGDDSERAYIFVHDPGGGRAGLFFGLLVGICYASLVTHWLEKRKPVKSVIGFATSAGMAAGIVSATLVHMMLMIVINDTNCSGIVIGIPYGVGAGAVLGLISGLILRKLYNEPQPIEPITETGAIE
ncbi:MAG: hypothetical protein OEV87_12010 [Phycisphaerae bacterium]|nr:hypothetical protein [Phycisphaerae bacterium]